jgi:predicted PurR-regulated permease PerM
MGSSYPFLLATIAALAWFIPLVGALFAIPMIAVIALLDGPTLSVAVSIYTILIFFLMEFGVEPRLYDRSKYGAILVILVMMAMSDALGITGLLLAPPLALTIQIIINEIMSAPVAPASVAVGVTLQDLEEQLTQVRTAVNQTETRSPRVQNMVERLEQLIQDTQKATT